MEKNKTGKYLKYAVGEILLVVIGILVAIQLNEWRNNNSNYKQKQNVLKALKLEFQSNLIQLDKVIFYNEKVLNAYPRAMELIKTQVVIVDNAVYQEPLQNLGWTWTFNPINGALRSGISSGEIHLINNDRLIELLFSWEDVVKDSDEEALKIRNYQIAALQHREKYIRIPDLWTKDFPGLIKSNYPSDYKGLFKDVLFEDYASFSFFWATEYRIELNVIKTNNLEILRLIEQELLK